MCSIQLYIKLFGIDHPLKLRLKNFPYRHVWKIYLGNSEPFFTTKNPHNEKDSNSQ